MTRNSLIFPVILCGGSGTRLWPLSRKAYPKQFARLMDETSLFQRAAGLAQGEGFAPPVRRHRGSVPLHSHGAARRYRTDPLDGAD